MRVTFAPMSYPRLLTLPISALIAISPVLSGFFCSDLYAESTPRVTIEVFLVENCPPCKQAENFLNELEVPYIRYDLRRNKKAEKDYLTNIGRGKIPAIRVNGSNKSVIRGFEPAQIVKVIGPGTNSRPAAEPVATPQQELARETVATTPAPVATTAVELIPAPTPYQDLPESESTASETPSPAVIATGSNLDSATQAEVTKLLDSAAAKLAKSDAQAALIDLNRVLELDPKSVRAWRERGVLKLKSLRDFKGAAADFTQALTLDAKDQQSLYQRGLAKQALGDSAGAQADYRSALELDPTLRAAHEALASLEEY
jgi:tetratricopeptide (TPR) repeat protein